MKRHHWLLFISLILLIVQPVASQNSRRTKFTIEPEIGYSFGDTQYEMVVRDNATSDVVVGVRSLLEFPINVFNAGITARLVGNAYSRSPWGLALTLTTIINDPGGKMKDGDWFLLRSGQSFKWSYTESNVKMSYIYVNFESSFGFPRTRHAGFDMIGGLRYERIVQDIFDFAGWQYDTLGIIHHFDIQEHGLYYRVSYLSPYFGFRFKSGNAVRTIFHVQAAFSPTYMKDYDDHLLRFKDATASGWGEGIFAQSGIRFNLQNERRSQPYFEFIGRFAYLHGSTLQTQRFYADDPGTAENENGLVLEDVPHTIQLTQFSLGARFGIEF